MTEFTKGIYRAVTNSMDESFILSVIFFIGHIIIAMVVVASITGATGIIASATDVNSIKSPVATALSSF